MANILTDDGHVLITGTTGAGEGMGGKTTTANWWHEQAVETGQRAASLFYNAKGQAGIRGYTCRSLGELAQAYQQGSRVLDFQPPSDYGAEEHEYVVQWFRRLPGEKQMVHDEVSFYSDSEGLNWCLAQGGNMGSDSIRSLVLTQYPWDLSQRHLNLLIWRVYVGEPTKSTQRFLEAMGLGQLAGEIRQKAAPYHWVAITGDEITNVYEPVPESYAPD